MQALCFAARLHIARAPHRAMPPVAARADRRSRGAEEPRRPEESRSQEAEEPRRRGDKALRR